MLDLDTAIEYASVLVEHDIEAWESERLLPRIVERRGESGCCSCEWELRDVIRHMDDLGITLSLLEAEQITDLYPTVLLGALDAEAELRDLEREISAELR